MENQYEKMSLAELRSLAKEKGITGITTKKKQELADLLNAMAQPAQGKPEKIKEEEGAARGTRTKTPRKGKSAEQNAGQDTEPEREKNASPSAGGDKDSAPDSDAEKTAKTLPAKDAALAVKPVPAQNTDAVQSQKAALGRRNTNQPQTAERRNIYTAENGERKGGYAAESGERKGGYTAENAERKGSYAAESAERKGGYTAENAERRISHAQDGNERRGGERGTYGSYQKNDNRQRGAVRPQPERTQGNPYTNQYNNNVYAQDVRDTRENAPVQPAAQMMPQNAGYRQGQPLTSEELEQLDSGETKEGILEIMPEGFGFIRCDNFLPGTNDVYVSPMQIRKMNLKTGDMIVGNTKIRSQTEKFSPLLYVNTINDLPPAEALRRPRFEDLTPIFPNERIHLETPGCKPAMRIVDLVSPIGKGQRGMIVSQPKAGKTTLLKQIAHAINKNHPEMHMIILLIDERPEEVTDIKESIQSDSVEVIYSTFDELPENHKRVSEMVIERAKRLVEHGKDVIILLDSITRLARAYNLTVQSSGRTLSGGLDPAALHMPKKFFGAARNMREGGSLTVLATALVETGSRMDDVVFEEFKGTGNMELVLDRNLSERRIFPAIDLPRSSTRREDLLLSQPEIEANILMRRAFNGMKQDEAVERIIQMFSSTKNNTEFIEAIKKTKFAY